MIKFIDNLLDRITMYRLILYYLILLLGVAVIFSFTGFLAYNPFALLFSTSFLVAMCSLTNWIFAKAFDVPPNSESVYISALILALIITPIQSLQDLWFLGWGAVLAMASKYIIAINHKHLFNPIAFAVALTYFTINQSASWWVGNAPLFPFVLIGGLLVVRRIRKFGLVLSFLFTSLITTMVLGFFSGDNLAESLQKTFLYSPILFFAFAILTEPLTMPPTQKLQIYYGAIVGFLSAPQLHIGAFYITPELTILFGNVFSYLVSPKTKLMLKLKEKRQVGAEIYDFIFTPTKKFAFDAGQYMEWTLGHDDPDSRGNRRYFTLASSPTEDDLRLGVKFYPNSSSFKKAMLAMKQGEEIVAAQLAGDFTLPQRRSQRCVFIAGGIGITPFRSMIKFLLDTRQRRPITLFYVNRNVNDIVYADVFEKAQKELGMKVIYALTDAQNIPSGWKGEVGRITARLIKEQVPDYMSCVFYISGPQPMVNSFKDTLNELGIRSDRVKTDFFAGMV